MIVVADTTPLNYLIQIDEIIILKVLFGRVLLPSAVLRELRADGAPVRVRQWAADLPAWVDLAELDSPRLLDAPLLGEGEREAIFLALSMSADIVLIDDGPARKVAKMKGLIVTGTLGLLREAADEGLLDFQAKCRTNPAAWLSDDR